MHVEKRMWRIDGDEPRAVPTAIAPANADLQALLRRDPSLLGERLLVIGSQVATASGVPLDVLAVDADGGLHVVELAGDAAGHEVVARALDHGS